MNKLKKFSDALELSSLYDNKQVCNIEICHEKLDELFEKECLQLASEKPTLRTFNLLTDNCKTTDHMYVTYACCLKKSDRSHLLRCGTLQLKVETGRFYSIPLEDRLCTRCNLNEVETEFHFLCECHFLYECELYKHLRTSLYDKITQGVTSFVDLSPLELFNLI